MLINTGDGKGKTTAGFGMLFRAWGRGMKVGCVQFIKSEGARYGEHIAADRIGFPVIPSGRGFTWTSKDLNEDAARAQYGWNLAAEMILSGDYDVVMLDEITYPITYGWIQPQDVLDVLKSRKKKVDVIITGRNAHTDLLEAADIVTEMRKIKHHYDKGIVAMPGVEY